jgi:hypothetical protein
MIASLSDGGVAYVLVPPLFTRRGRGDAGSKSGPVRRIPSSHVPSCAIPFLRAAPTPDPWLNPPHEEGHAPVHPGFAHLPSDRGIRVVEDGA